MSSTPNPLTVVLDDLKPVALDDLEVVRASSVNSSPNFTRRHLGASWAAPRDWAEGKQPTKCASLPSSTAKKLAVGGILALVCISLLAAYFSGALKPSPAGSGGGPLQAPPPFASLPNSVTFLALGDWGREGNAAQRLPVPAMALWAEALKAKGALTCVPLRNTSATQRPTAPPPPAAITNTTRAHP